MAFHYLAVEGPIGVGKTSLARRLAEVGEGQLLLEAPDDNPFIGRFYEDRKRNALPAQLFFLLARAEQARQLMQGELFTNLTVADFLFEKDPLFARLNLDESEFQLYQKIYEGLRPHASPPDLVIYLQAPVNVLSERVRRRNRAYERQMSERYLGELASAYNEFFYHYDAAPVLTVNCEHLNFSEREADFQLLRQRIGEMRGPREFFSLGA